jgi:hypothetical protein
VPGKNNNKKIEEIPEPEKKEKREDKFDRRCFTV